MAVVGNRDGGTMVGTGGWELGGSGGGAIIHGCIELIISSDQSLGTAMVGSRDGGAMVGAGSWELGGSGGGAMMDGDIELIIHKLTIWQSGRVGICTGPWVPYYPSGRVAKEQHPRIACGRARPGQERRSGGKKKTSREPTRNVQTGLVIYV